MKPPEVSLSLDFAPHFFYNYKVLIVSNKNNKKERKKRKKKLEII